MKQKNYFLLLILTFFQLVSNAQTLDQSNAPANSGGGGFQVNNSGQTVGQSFVAGLTGTLSQVNVYLGSYNFAAGDFRLSIINGDGYGGVVEGTQDFTLSSYPGDGEYAISITNTINITAGNTYTLKFEGITGSINMLAPSGDIFTNGILYYGSGSSFSSYDLWFKTYVTVPTPATHLNFDGANDYVNLGTSISSAINNTSTLTLEAWINPSALNGWNNIITDYNGSYHKILLRVRNNNNIQFWLNSTVLNSAFTVPLNTWTHIAAVYDGSNMYVYANGTLVGSQAATVSLPTTTDQFNIGSRIGSNTENFTGNIDEVRVWTTARTVEQINGSMNCELQGTESGLVAYYQFNQGTDQADNTSVTTLTDASSNGYDGTLTNFALTGSTSNWLAGSPVTTGSTVPSTPAAPSDVTICAGEDTNEIVVNRVCGTVTEGNALTLTAPTGFTFTSIPFASYGTPNGSCGSYTLGSCHATTSQSVVETALIGQNSANINATNAVFGDPCSGTSKRLYVEALYGSITWTNDTPSIGLAASGSGQIPAFTAVNNTESPIVATITISYNNGSCSAINSFTITVNPLPSTPVAIDQSFCSAATADDLVPAISSTTNWYTSASSTTPLVPTDALSTATYYVAKTNTNGCESARTAVNITISSSVVITTQPQDQTIVETDSLVFTVASTGATSYQWEVSTDGGSTWMALNDSFANPDVSGSTTNTLTVSGSNMIMLNGYLFRVILGASPCTDVTSNEALATVTLSSRDFSVDNGIKIYPNPFQSDVTVELQNITDTDTSLKVYDINGRLLKDKKLNASQNRIDMHDLPSGLYLFQITSNERTLIQKVVKK